MKGSLENQKFGQVRLFQKNNDPIKSEKASIQFQKYRRFTKGNLTELTSYAALFGRDDIIEQTIENSFRYFIMPVLDKSGEFEVLP
ncbi:MAG: hypothetical protein GY796_26755 [Chloroflexi bacterium]|nr:hypothetical protein [Chloroflexota bacterium]